MSAFLRHSQQLELSGGVNGLSPAQSRASALYIDVFGFSGERVSGVTKMMMVQGGAHIFPAGALINAERVAIIYFVAGKIVPHFLPFWMIDVQILHRRLPICIT